MYGNSHDIRNGQYGISFIAFEREGLRMCEQLTQNCQTRLFSMTKTAHTITAATCVS